MASNVFGNPITDATLMGLPEYADKTITRRDRAMVALDMKNAENKDERARVFVEGLKSQWGDGVSTLCLVYNATGDTIRFVTNHDWWGHIGPSPYPGEIANGQWGAFLHVKRAITPDGSEAAVVYRGLNNAGQECDWMFAWTNPWGKVFGHENRVYTEIREAGHFPPHWNYINSLLLKSGQRHTDTWNGSKSTVTTGDYTSPKLEAILTLL